MKKFFILLTILFSTLAVSAEGKVVVNPFTYVCDLVTVKFQSLTSVIQTTKITVDEGTYRIFTINNCEGVSITAVKIK